MIFGSGGLLVVMMVMVIGDSDTDNGVCDDDVTCGVGWLYWQEVWRNRGMREWSCEVTRSQKTKPLFRINVV